MNLSCVSGRKHVRNRSLHVAFVLPLYRVPSKDAKWYVVNGWGLKPPFALRESCCLHKLGAGAASCLEN